MTRLEKIGAILLCVLTVHIISVAQANAQIDEAATIHACESIIENTATGRCK